MDRTPKASKAIKQFNYFSRRAIKRYSAFPHWITQPDSWKSLPTHMSFWPWDTSMILCNSDVTSKKRTLDIICLMSYSMTHFEKENVIPIDTLKVFYCCHSFPHSLVTPPLILCWFVQGRKKTRTKSWEIKWFIQTPCSVHGRDANLLLGTKRFTARAVRFHLI